MDPAAATASPGTRGATIVLQVVLGVFTPLALISVGGLGIFTAPLLLPLLWVIARQSRGGGRWYFTFLAALVAAESGWAFAWSVAPALQLPLPIAFAAATSWIFVHTSAKGDLKEDTTALVIVALLIIGGLGVAGAALYDGEVTREVRMEKVGR